MWTGYFSHEVLVTFDISGIEELEFWGFWFGGDDGVRVNGESKLSAENKRE